MTDAIVVGGGHTGLVAAALLARAGLGTVVLERTDRVGGCIRTTEIAPGCRVPTLSHAVTLDPAIVRALNLEQHGLRLIDRGGGAADIAIPLSGRAGLVLSRDAAATARAIGALSADDAGRYPRFLDSFAGIARVLRTALDSVPPSIDDPSAADLIELLKAGRAFRKLSKADGYRLLRWVPMPVADLASEWFESDAMRAAVAGGGILGAFLGPRSAGTAAVLMLLGAETGHPFATGWAASGGPGAVADALAAAARAAGAEVRTAAEVAQVNVSDGAANGVTLSTGERIEARAVLSNLDPKRTLLGLVDPLHLTPDLIHHARSIRAHGTLAKINYAVDRAPQFTGLEKEALTGRIRLAERIDDIERAFDAAKYGRVSDNPWIELTVPSLSDPSLAPEGRHVVSAYAQYAPYHLRGTDWDAERDRLADTATAVIERYAPGFQASIVARETFTPLDLERSFGLTGGHIFHGELAIDQLFVARPLLGWARYAMPVRNLYLCGSGAHPGNGVSGRAGALAARTVIAALRRRR
jgi:phytoene dehydrogenase-like protein